jgi:hypothetical protein
VDHQIVLVDEVYIKTLIFDLLYQFILERFGMQGEVRFWGVRIAYNNNYLRGILKRKAAGLSAGRLK